MTHDNDYLEKYEKVIRNAMIAAFEETKQILVEYEKFDEPRCHEFARQVTRSMLMKAAYPFFGGIEIEDILGGKRCR